MDIKKKIFVSKVPSDEEIDEVKDLLKTQEVKGYLKEHFVYIYFDDEDDSIQVLAFEDKTVFMTSKEYCITNKQAVQFIFHSFEIGQAVKELLYWSGIGNTKKYVPVIAEAKMKDGMNKIYAEFAIYASDDIEAGVILSDMDYDQYLYLEDVDE